MGNTTTTDPRSQCIQVGRRGGQLKEPVRRLSNGCPPPCSRCPLSWMSSLYAELFAEDEAIDGIIPVKNDSSSDSGTLPGHQNGIRPKLSGENLLQCCDLRKIERHDIGAPGMQGQEVLVIGLRRVEAGILPNFCDDRFREHFGL